jgi:hypothetical protein
VARRAPADVYGPRAAAWEVFLDGRSVTIAWRAEYAVAQGREAVAVGREARVERTEFCPACGTADGVIDVRRRGRMFPVKTECKTHAPAWVSDEDLG